MTLDCSGCKKYIIPVVIRNHCPPPPYSGKPAVKNIEFDLCDLASELSASLDVKTKVTEDDTTGNYLSEKLIDGKGVSFFVINPGGNEEYQADLDLSTVDEDAGALTEDDQIAVYKEDGSTVRVPISLLPASGGSNFTHYNAGSDIWVTASDVTVTASKLSGVYTITIPVGVIVTSVYVLGIASDIQVAADAGGVSNWVQVVFSGVNDKVPIVSKIIKASGVPSVSNPYTIDIDNNPGVSVVGHNPMKIRVGGLIAPDGFQLAFSL